MEITINIPKEFENHFNSDKFEDSLQRIRFDIHKAIIARKDILSGEYEIETLDMITEAFLKGTPLPKGHGRLIDANELIKSMDSWDKFGYSAQYGLEWLCKDDKEYVHYEDMVTAVTNAPTIIEADKVESEDKWR